MAKSPLWLIRVAAVVWLIGRAGVPLAAQSPVPPPWHGSTLDPAPEGHRNRGNQGRPEEPQAPEQPQEPEEPGEPQVDADFVIRGGERLVWNQAVPDVDALRHFRFRLYVGTDTNIGIAARCELNAASEGAECHATLPPLSAGLHVLSVSVGFDDEAGHEGPRSAGIVVRVEP